MYAFVPLICSIVDVFLEEWNEASHKLKEVSSQTSHPESFSLYVSRALAEQQMRNSRQFMIIFTYNFDFSSYNLSHRLLVCCIASLLDSWPQFHSTAT